MAIPRQCLRRQHGADGSAYVHLLLAARAIAARNGLSDSGSLDLAERLNTSDHDFEQVPTCCAASADPLERELAMFEADGIFPSELIDAVQQRLRGYDDAKLMKKISENDAAREDLVRRYRHVD